MLTKSSRTREKLRIGEVLMQQGLINQAQLTAALAEQKHSGTQLGEILVSHGWVNRTQLRQALNEQRWRNLIATVLLSTTTLLPSATQLVTNTPVVAHSSPIEQDDILQFRNDRPERLPKKMNPVAANYEHDTSYMSLIDTGGAETASASQAKPATESVLAQQPLQDNPTVSSPLQGFCHPLNGQGWLSQGIRGRTHQGRMEYAYDLAADIGTPVYAMRPGRVIAVQDKYPDTGGGKENIAKFNYVWVEHDGGYRSAYIHLQQGFVGSIGIKAGDWVEAGQLIGYSGNSGWSTGPHLHLEVQRPGRNTRQFTKTAPFAIAGTCDNGQLARK
ncbi:Lysostaphin [Acaryochloris thomasi RCC1774]|uniref:Lysostaphin n=1 Tax=Acaryochloris thomasi RCC1774 TaxID=1764569 RepID=A0A2W1JNB7_9CYAN|nr:M23 family metallopeptidase [Acaryochloris thomasi]PZD71634.1 Lysostaphin [Acaryochloris thomasi RCC1774]